MANHVLLCDLTFGSTLKLALTPVGHRPSQVSLRACPNRAAFDAEVMAFLSENGHPALAGAAIASRGWERRGVLQLPDADMTLARDDVRGLLGVQRLHLVNNFVARAMAIPRLKPDEVEKICGKEAMDEQVMAVLGPHHGLGLAVLVPDGSGLWTAMPCEGGHSDLPVTSEREEAVCRVLRTRHGHVAREFVLSLDGLVQVATALAELEDVKDYQPTVDDIITDAEKGEPLASEAVRLSMGWLAGMAADVALILGARGGIYLTGDLMERLKNLFDIPAFCARLTDKGRLSTYVSEIPVYRTHAPNMQIIGLATLFE